MSTSTESAATLTWAPCIVAILGGDNREHEVIRSYLEIGCEVRTFGTVFSESYSHLISSSALKAVTDANVIVTPVPGIGSGDTLYAPSAEEPIVVTAQLLSAAQEGAVFFAGRATPTIERAGKERGIRFVHLYDDDELQIRHAIPTAEGAIAKTVENTDDVIVGARAMVIGYGRIAKVLAERLKGMGAAVTVAARKPEALALAEAMGLSTVHTDDLHSVVGGFDLIYNTAPAVMLTSATLAEVSESCLVLDLAAPPGGVDRQSVDLLGLNYVWARGQAGTAPRHSGRAQFLSMARALSELTSA